MIVRILHGVLLAAIVAFATGCGDTSADIDVKGKGATLKIEEVPKNVMEAAQKRLPNVKFAEAWKNVHKKTGEVHSYEIRGKIPETGKTKEVRVDLKGNILEEE